MDEKIKEYLKWVVENPKVSTTGTIVIVVVGILIFLI
jgi:hypothetical protein